MTQTQGRPPQDDPLAIPALAGLTRVSAPDDAAWSARFGATNVGMRPEAVAVAGDTIYLGGDFAGPMAGMPEGTYDRVAAWDGHA